ncbi:conserved Plasmodium protein, unknown function [Plasmodium ovale]|uniref:Uncharacterized protein n=2 Tax=Plasmodium ovale TaxID=36330 RepID=A0A1A8VN98_PLAOA|nr:hypothetical protein POVCU1_000010 [Plasmodium ovale curtisi]SBS96000.1 hypothetical protein POVCU2_0100510 [Plasmodium ovale curtisi]SCD22287.1 conserved Plasmodium protein, unknown function [Plasmodium ovale]
MYPRNNFEKPDPTSPYSRQYEESDENNHGLRGGMGSNPTWINLSGGPGSALAQNLGINSKNAVQFLVNMFIYVASIVIGLKIWDYMTYSKCDYYKDLLLRIVRYQSHLNDGKMA